MGLGFGIGIRRRDLVINRGDLHIVCGHREGDGLAVDIHRISGQTLLDLPVAEGLAFLRLPCNESDFLTKCTLFCLPVHGQGVAVLLVLRGQRNVVCGHREGNGCAVDVRISGQTFLLPTSEGVAVLLGCGNRDFLTKCTLFCLPVHGQGVAVLLVLRGQRNVVCGHREGDGRLGGVHVSQTGHFPTGEGVTVLLVCGEAELLTCNVLGRLVVHGQSVLRLRHSIGVHFVLGAIVVVTIIHHDVNAVSACLGGLRHRRERAILRDIPDRIQRCIVKIHRSFIGCSLGLGVILKVVELRLISAYHLADIKRAFCVLVARFRYDALLVDAI